VLLAGESSRDPGVVAAFLGRRRWLTCPRGRLRLTRFGGMDAGPSVERRRGGVDVRDRCSLVPGALKAVAENLRSLDRIHAHPFAAEVPALLSAGVPISNRYRRSRAAALTVTGVLAFRFDAPGDLFTPQASAPALAADGKDERPSGSSRFGERASGGEQAAAATGSVTASTFGEAHQKNVSVRSEYGWHPPSPGSSRLDLAASAWGSRSEDM
jgi:hypothetical protein